MGGYMYIQSGSHLCGTPCDCICTESAVCTPPETENCTVYCPYRICEGSNCVTYEVSYEGTKTCEGGFWSNCEIEESCPVSNCSVDEDCGGGTPCPSDECSPEGKKVCDGSYVKECILDDVVPLGCDSYLKWIYTTCIDSNDCTDDGCSGALCFNDCNPSLPGCNIGEEDYCIACNHCPDGYCNCGENSSNCSLDCKTCDSINISGVIYTCGENDSVCPEDYENESGISPNCTGDCSDVDCGDFCEDNDLGMGSGDGYGVCPNCNRTKGCRYDGHDCDDSDYYVNPGMPEICNNSKDDDCDGYCDYAGCFDRGIDMDYDPDCQYPPFITQCSINGFFAPGEEVTVDCEFEEYQQLLSEIDVYIWAGECEFGNCYNTRSWATGEGTVYYSGWDNTSEDPCGNGVCDTTIENYNNCPDDCPAPSCFLAKTKITMSDGSLKNIEDINQGDMVLSYDIENKEKVPVKVLKTFVHNTNDYLIINNNLKLTSNHPLLINDKWNKAESIKIGDKLKDVNNNDVIVKTIEKIKEKVKVYNLEVNEPNSYIAEGIVVHNKEEEELAGIEPQINYYYKNYVSFAAFVLKDTGKITGYAGGEANGNGNGNITPDKMSCSGVGSPYSCTKTFTLINNEEDFFNKAIAITVVAYDGMGYSTWFDMYDASDPVHFPEENCNDGLDNDGDGYMDCGDSECYDATYLKSSVCGYEPDGVDRSLKDHPGLAPPRDQSYCSQGSDPIDPIDYGRCCRDQEHWDPVDGQCEMTDVCENCNKKEFTEAWWNDPNCIRRDADDKIIYTCHNTTFFGSPVFVDFPIKII